MTVLKEIYLEDRIKTSINFLKTGLAEFQKFRIDNSYCELPMITTSFGIENLIKSLIVIHYWNDIDQINKLNNNQGIKTHKLSTLLENLTDICEEKKFNRPALQSDLIFMKTNKHLEDLINLFSKYGQGGRYYSLDMILKEKSSHSNPIEEWEKVKNSFLDERQDVKDRFFNEPQYDYHPEIMKELIIILERFFRALSRLFTLGDFGELAKKMSPLVYTFLMKMDKDLGKTEYLELNLNFDMK